MLVTTLPDPSQGFQLYCLSSELPDLETVMKTLLHQYVLRFTNSLPDHAAPSAAVQ